MLRASSLAAQCALGVVGPAARGKERVGIRLAVPVVRALAGSATQTAGSSAAHVPEQRQQRRHVSQSSSSCGWATAVGVPGLVDDLRECSKEASSSRQALEVSPFSTGGERFPSPGRTPALLLLLIVTATAAPFVGPTRVPLLLYCSVRAVAPFMYRAGDIDTPYF